MRLAHLPEIALDRPHRRLGVLALDLEIDADGGAARTHGPGGVLVRRQELDAGVAKDHFDDGRVLGIEGRVNRNHTDLTAGTEIYDASFCESLFFGVSFFGWMGSSPRM